MKSGTINSIFLIMIALIIAATTYYTKRSLEEQHKKLTASVREVFILALEKDLKKRFSEIEAPFIISSSSKDFKPGGTGKLIDNKGTRYLKKSTQDQLSFLEKMRQFQQTALIDSNPINANALAAIFRHELAEKHIPAKTAVIVNDGKTNKNARSSADPRLYNSSFKTGPFQLGLLKEIEVSAYALVPWWYTTIQTLQYPPVIILLSAIFLSGLIWMIMNKRARLNTLPEASPETRTDNGTYRIGKLLVNSTTQLVFSGNEPVKVTERDYQLLLLFLRSYNHYLAREKIIQHFWSEKEDCTDRINTSISRLRKILKEADSSLKIVTEKKAGYRLVEQGETAFQDSSLQSPTPT